MAEIISVYNTPKYVSRLCTALIFSNMFMILWLSCGPGSIARNVLVSAVVSRERLLEGTRVPNIVSLFTILRRMVLSYFIQNIPVQLEFTISRVFEFALLAANRDSLPDQLLLRFYAELSELSSDPSTLSQLLLCILHHSQMSIVVGVVLDWTVIWCIVIVQFPPVFTD